MVSAIYGKEISLNGLDIHLLKSAIQKYVRRAIWDKGVWCLVELDLFSLAKDDKKVAYSIRTNMVNRLIIIMSEDICIAEPSLPTLLLRLYKEWAKYRETKYGRKYLLEMYWLLVKSRKIRLICDLRAFYASSNNPLMQKLKYQGEDCAQDDVYNKVVALMGKDELFYYLYKLRDARMINKLWEYLVKSPQKSTVQSLWDFYKILGQHREKWLFLHHAVLLVSRNVNTTEESPNEKIELDIDAIYSRNLAGETVEIDDYCKDMHAGGTGGALEFALVGAYVENEAKELLNEDYRRIFIEIQKIKDNSLNDYKFY